SGCYRDDGVWRLAINRSAVERRPVGPGGCDGGRIVLAGGALGGRADCVPGAGGAGWRGLAGSRDGMNLSLLFLLLLKAPATTFGGLASLPVIRHDLVVNYHVLTDRQLTAAVAAGRTAPGPNGLYLVSVGYFVAGVPGACVGCLAMITP